MEHIWVFRVRFEPIDVEHLSTLNFRWMSLVLSECDKDNRGRPKTHALFLSPSVCVLLLLDNKRLEVKQNEIAEAHKVNVRSVHRWDTEKKGIKHRQGQQIQNWLKEIRNN